MHGFAGFGKLLQNQYSSALERLVLAKVSVNARNAL